MKKLLSCVVLSALLAMSSTAFAQSGKEGKLGTQTLPNGATSLNETYGMWTVSCGIQDGVKNCGLLRQEVNAQNQPVITMNVTTNTDGDVSGILVMPFGILVSKPIHLQVDDSKIVVETAVRTCMPAGCVVPVAFNKAASAALRAGKQLKITAISAGPGEPAIDNLFVQLDGFGGALDRLVALKK